MCVCVCVFGRGGGLFERVGSELFVLCDSAEEQTMRTV